MRSPWSPSAGLAARPGGRPAPHPGWHLLLLLLLGLLPAAAAAFAPPHPQGCPLAAACVPRQGAGQLLGLNHWVKHRAGEGLEAAFSVTVPDHGAAPRGAHASRPLREGDPYLVVPWRLVLGPHSVAAGTALHGCLAALGERYGRDPLSEMLLILLHETFVRGPASEWWHYLNALPRRFATPLHWPAEALRELQGSQLFDEAVREHSLAHTVFKGFEGRVFPQCPEAFPAGAVDLGAFKWAWSVYHSRTSHVPGKEGAVLVPLADMINDAELPGRRRAAGAGAAGDPPPGEAAGGEGGGDGAAGEGFVEYNPGLDAAVVYTKRDYAANEELVEDYGRWSMADRLQLTGHLPASNASDCVLLELSEGSLANLTGAAAVAPPAGGLRDALAARGFPDRELLCLDASARAWGRFAEFVGALGAAGTGVANATAPEEGMLRFLQRRAEGYPTSGEEDEALLEYHRHPEVRNGTAGGVVLAIEYRRREKAVLRDLIDRAADRILARDAHGGES